MAVLSFVEVADGKIKKASVEAAYYGSKVAESLGTHSISLVIGEASEDVLAALGQVGVVQVVQVADARFANFDSKLYTKILAQSVSESGANVVVMSFNNNGKLLAPRLSAKLKAGYVPGAVELPVFNGNTAHM